jgi:hypothetical protein
MFITLEDETSVANLVVWTNVFEKHRRVVLGAKMMGVRGQVQRERDVIPVVVRDLIASTRPEAGKAAGPGATVEIFFRARFRAGFLLIGALVSDSKGHVRSRNLGGFT